MDPIDRQQAIDAIFSEPLYKSGMKKRDVDEVVPAIYEKIRALPSAQPDIIHCKDCKHYHTDVFGQELGFEGLYGNLIVAHNACDKWSEYMNSVDPDGFCFLAERRTDAAK